MGNAPDFYDGFLENTEINGKIKELVNDYIGQKTGTNISNIIKQNIFDEASKLSKNERAALREVFMKSALSLSGDDKIQYYELAAGLHNLQSTTEINEKPTGIDFSITQATAEIKTLDGKKDYILNQRGDPVFTQIGENIYSVIMNFKRDSSSSLKGNKNIHLTFRYNGKKILFFNDKDSNGLLDKNEGGTIIKVPFKEGTTIDKINGKPYIHNEGIDMKINLGRKAITEPLIRSLNLTLSFN
ncbi:hypothetical protein A9Q91_05230 [Candidatus Gracilibacteria bacterium 28_42_T64]|nr:hypothetical protein A9Q91_05230 [Candidatus Gracilibacteria bacterium 28_42_T64]